MTLRPVMTGVAFGFCIWLSSQLLFGRAEPWDGDSAVAYLLLLAVGGFLHVALFNGSLKVAFWSVYLGQFLYGLFQMIRGEGSLFPLGALVLLAWNLPVLAGAFIARRMLANQAVKDAGDVS